MNWNKWQAYVKKTQKATSLIREYCGRSNIATLIGCFLCRPYLIVSVTFAAVSVLYLATKAIMLRHPLVSKWGALILVCGLFSAAHIIVALNVNLFARRRQQMGLLGQVFVLLKIWDLHAYGTCTFNRRRRASNDIVSSRLAVIDRWQLNKVPKPEPHPNANPFVAG